MKEKFQKNADFRLYTHFFIAIFYPLFDHCTLQSKQWQIPPIHYEQKRFQNDTFLKYTQIKFVIYSGCDKNHVIRAIGTTRKDLILNEKKTQICHFWNQVYPYHVSRKLSQITIELARSLILQKKSVTRYRCTGYV